MTESLLLAVAAVNEQLPAALLLGPDERAHALRRLLRAEVHDAVMRLSADHHARYDEPTVADLRALAAVVRDDVPAGAEDRLGVRVRVFVRLLRRDTLEPAWMLAQDDASGVVRPSKAASTWAGGSRLGSALPLPTHVEGGHVYAWLPGFRDPRWGVPDEVFDISGDVVLRGELDEAILVGGRLELYGSAYLGLLAAGPDDEITIALSGPAGTRYRVHAERVRRPDLVKPSGPDLTRLAWAGWRASVELAPMLNAPGVWRPRLEIVEHGIERSELLGRRRGPLAQPRPEPVPHRFGAATICLERTEKNAGLQVRVRRLSAASYVPQPVCRMVRRVLPRR